MNNMDHLLSARFFRLWIGAVSFLFFVGSAGVASSEPDGHELTLEDCIGLALQNNLDLHLERVSRESARADIAAAQGGYDPALVVSASRRHEETLGRADRNAAEQANAGSDSDTDSWSAGLAGETALAGLRYDISAKSGNTSGTSGGNPFDTSTGSAGITLTQPLLKGFKTGGARYQVLLARKQFAEFGAQLENKMQNILMQVESAWYSLIQARESIRVQEEAVHLATQLYADNQRKVQIGALSILDEKQAESQAAAARADLSAARQTYAEAQNRLKALIFADHRRQRAADIQAVGELTAEPVVVDVVASGEQALANRPDLRQTRLALARQEIVTDYQKNQALPALDLVGGYGVAATHEDRQRDVFERLHSADEPFWTLGVTLSIPLGNRTARARHTQSVLSAERLKLTLRQQEEAVLVAVDNAASAVASGQERVQATREAREYAEQALAAEQRKLDSGKSTSFIVLQLQRDLTQARKSEISALADYNQQLANLALAEGNMLAHHGIELMAEK